MHRRAIITNTQFVYAGQRKKLRGLLRYFQYRNDKTSADHVRQVDAHGQRVERWRDRGLGSDYRTILASCLELATTHLQKNVSARLLVIAPEVHWMAAIPEERRAHVLRELTEATVEGWFEQLNLPTAEYAYVCHASEPSDLRPDGTPKDAPQLSSTYLHSHVALAATVPGLEQERESYKVYDRQIQALHEAGRTAMAHIWTRELGAERVADLTVELEARTQQYAALDQQTGQRAFTRTLAEPLALEPAREPSPPREPDPNLEIDP